MNEYLNREKAANIKSFLIIEKFAIENSLLLLMRSGFPINFIISIFLWVYTYCFIIKNIHKKVYNKYNLKMYTLPKYIYYDKIHF